MNEERTKKEGRKEWRDEKINTNSVFESITSSSSGGALSFSGLSQESKLFIEQSSFTECHTDGNGGAIYFCCNGQCVLSKVCGYKCSTTNSADCQFDYVYTSDALTYKNEVNDSSIVYTFNSNNAWYTLFHYYGRIIVNSVNVSRNYCYGTSGIYCYPSKSTQTSSCAPSCLITLSTFTNNTAHTYYICLELSKSDAYKEIRQSNVIRNTQTSQSYGIIYSNCNLNIISSCILENVAQYILYEGSSSYSIKVINSTTDSSITTYGSVSIEDKAKIFVNENINI